MSLIAFLLAQASHKPGHLPTPPYPPHAHIEVAQTVSSVVAEVSVANLSHMHVYRLR